MSYLQFFGANVKLKKTFFDFSFEQFVEILDFSKNFWNPGSMRYPKVY